MLPVNWYWCIERDSLSRAAWWPPGGRRIYWDGRQASEAEEHRTATKIFWESVAQKYGRYPHVIFEAWSEPSSECSGDQGIKPFRTEVKDIIRLHSRNIIVVNVPNLFSEGEDVLPSCLPPDVNIVIGMHGYMCGESHVQSLIDGASKVLKNKYAIMQALAQERK